MSTVFSKVTTKSQTVIPREVRERLGLKPGDRIRYRIEADRVVIDRDRSQPADDPFVAFTEWAGDDDERAYAEL
jgi:AbrB family looped-hinge helix DNA binding protein